MVALLGRINKTYLDSPAPKIQQSWFPDPWQVRIYVSTGFLSKYAELEGSNAIAQHLDVLITVITCIQKME